MKAIKLILTAAAAVSSSAALASAEIVDGVLVFDVQSGTEKYGGSIGANVSSVRKIGAGTMTVLSSNGGFSGKTVSVEAGILEATVKDSLGAGNVVKVTGTGQYKMTFDGTYSGSEGALNTFELEGEGPDGTGALYLGKGASSTRCDRYLGDFKLTGDATIGSYAGQWRGVGGVCDLNGKALTVVGDTYFLIGNAGTVWKPGNINLKVGTILLGKPTFEGGAENVLTVNGGFWQFWSLQTPIPWTVVFPKATTIELGECFVNGAYSTNCNIFAGPVQYKGTLNIVGYSGKTNPGRCMTFAGPVSNIEGDTSYIYFSEHNPQVYFTHKNTFHGVSIGKSERATAHGLVDGSLPSIVNPTHYLSLHGNGAGLGGADIWLGEGHCSAAWASKVIASLDSWNSVFASAKLGLRTFGDYTFDADIPEPSTVPDKDKIHRVGVSHVGTGTLTYTAAFPSASDRKVWLVQREDNLTVLGAPDGQQVNRQLAGLSVCSGTVEVARGASLTNSTGYRICVGGYESAAENNTSLPAKLVVSDGGTLYAQENTYQLKAGARGKTPAIVEFRDGARVTYNLSGGENEGDKSAYHQLGGDVYTLSRAGADGYLAKLGRGFYGLYGGSFTNNTFLTLGGIPDTTGVTRGSGLFLQTGGTAWFCGDNGVASAMVTRGGEGEYLMRGGTLRGTGDFMIAGQQYGKTDVAGASGVFSLHGDGNPSVEFDGRFFMTSRKTGVVSMLNLNAGTFSAKKFWSDWCVSAEADVTCVLNFNGGTYKIRPNDDANVTFLDGRPYRIVVYGKGGTFDVPANKGYWLSDRQGNPDSQLVFTHATGKGLKSVRIPANMPRTGYSGIVPCKVVGGGKDAKASVALDYDPATGTIAEDLLITCPGCDYTEAPQVIAYGPDFTTEYACDVELTDEAQELNPGKLYKTGPGTFAVNVANNTFCGTYVISNGTLKIPTNHTISDKASVFVAGGKFWYDWKTRVIKSLGGYGGFYGYKGNDSTHRLTVTGSLDFDVADLLAGRFLEMESDIGDKQTVNKDNLYLGADCVVRLAHPELLPEDPASYTLLTVNVPLNRTPVLADADKVADGKWKVKLTNGGKTLKLTHHLGYCIYLR